MSDAPPIDSWVRKRSRLPARLVGGRSRAADYGLLMLIGGLAAVAVTVLDFSLRIPGHAILRSIFPMAFGLALVPRRGAGMLMAAGATGGLALLYGWGRLAPGAGATTGLLLVGPALDVAVHLGRSGRRLYFALAAAGCAANLAAMAVRAAAKWTAGPAGGRLPLEVWAWPASVTYPLCGILAGLLSAAVWFKFRAVDQPRP